MSRKFVRYYYCYEPAGMTCNPFIKETTRERFWDAIHRRNDPHYKPNHFLSICNNASYDARVFKSIFIARRDDKSFDITTYMAIYADKETHNELIQQFNNIHNHLKQIEEEPELDEYD